MPIEKYNLPVGRIVWGHPMRATKKTDPQTKQPVLRDGQPVEQWSFGIAIPKDPFNEVYGVMHQEAVSAFPNGVPGNFAWKFKDGDGVDRQGQPFSKREGYAGHYVLTVSTEAFQPPCFKYEGNGYRQLNENEIKCGDYVRVNVTFKANVPTSRTHTPGIYVNPNGVELVGYGTEIVGTGSADPTEMFGGQPVTNLPPGASATPIGGAPENMQMPTGMPPQQQPPGMPPPAHDFVQNTMGNPPTAPDAGMSQPPAAPQGYPSATPATSYPGSMPGIPPNYTG